MLTVKKILESAVAVQGIQLIWIVVKDLKKAIQFYTEVVGMKLHELNEGYGWAELSGTQDGTRLGIAQMNDRENIQPGQNAVVTMSVANLEKSREELIRKGIKMVGEVIEVPGVVKMQTLTDVDGNHFQLVESLV
jgi:predicted enzyme related to lactoylglutathione lyase